MQNFGKVLLAISLTSNLAFANGVNRINKSDVADILAADLADLNSVEGLPAAEAKAQIEKRKEDLKNIELGLNSLKIDLQKRQVDKATGQSVTHLAASTTLISGLALATTEMLASIAKNQMDSRIAKNYVKGEYAKSAAESAADAEKKATVAEKVKADIALIQKYQRQVSVMRTAELYILQNKEVIQSVSTARTGTYAYYVKDGNINMSAGVLEFIGMKNESLHKALMTSFEIDQSRQGMLEFKAINNSNYAVLRSKLISDVAGIDAKLAESIQSIEKTAVKDASVSKALSRGRSAAMLLALPIVIGGAAVTVAGTVVLSMDQMEIRELESSIKAYQLVLKMKREHLNMIESKLASRS